MPPLTLQSSILHPLKFLFHISDSIMKSFDLERIDNFKEISSISSLMDNIVKRLVNNFLDETEIQDS